MKKQITYKRFGEQAILITWESKICTSILEDILLFKEKILLEKSNLLSDTIVGYNSLTLLYSNFIFDFSIEINSLKNSYQKEVKQPKKEHYLWKIPVCYDLEFGIDLEEISKEKSIAIAEIIRLHSEPKYTIFFTGFLPGFLYLGGLHDDLFVRRKSTPRLKVEKGSVGIGGQQTGIYPMNSVGGWNIIGKTLIDFFDVNKDTPCFAKSGDQLQFIPISIEEFHQIELETTKKSVKFSKISFDD